MLLEPKEIQLNNKTYVLSKFPAVEGREIAMQLPISALPKLGDYKTNESIMFKMLAYVGVRAANNQLIMLSTKDLINNHVKSFEDLMQLEWLMVEYNCSFFQNGKVSSFLAWIAETFQELTIKMLTPSSDLLSPKEKPHFTN